MSIRVGWSRSRPKLRRPGKVAGGIWIFELLKAQGSRGRHFVVGILKYNRQDLQSFLEKGQTLDIRVIGLLRLEPDVTSAHVESVFNQIKVTGKIIAPPELHAVIDRLSEAR